MKLHDWFIVEMVIVVVGNDYEVNVRQIRVSQLKGWLDKTPEGTSSLTKYNNTLFVGNQEILISFSKNI